MKDCLSRISKAAATHLLLGFLSQAARNSNTFLEDVPNHSETLTK